MGKIRPRRKDRFGKPEPKPHLRIICATLGPGKSRLLGLIAEEHSISEAARKMKMSYQRARQLIEAMNACFREPLVESVSGGTKGGGSRLSPLGRQVLELYEAIHAKGTAATARELKRLHSLLKLP